MSPKVPTPAPSQLAIWVDVTDQHINAGCPEDCRSCAAAIAIAETLQLRPARPRSRPVLQVWVDEEIVCLPGIAVWATPILLRGFVRAFDDWHSRGGRRPGPIGFWLPEPDLPGGSSWEAAVNRGLMPERLDGDSISKLAWLAAGPEVVE